VEIFYYGVVTRPRHHRPAGAARASTRRRVASGIAVAVRPFANRPAAPPLRAAAILTTGSIATSAPLANSICSRCQTAGPLVPGPQASRCHRIYLGDCPAVSSGSRAAARSANSLVTGKLTGNFQNFCCHLSSIGRPFSSRRPPMLWRMPIPTLPYALMRNSTETLSTSTPCNSAYSRLTRSMN
jgi:hypothetical protein